jgi:riboflavin kinase/FMN adenylyltransferase
VLTFDPHPDAVLRPENAPSLLTTSEEKLSLLRDLGVQLSVVAEFNARLAATAAEVFVKEVLVAQLRARCIIVGADWRFGAGGRGTPALLRALAPGLGYRVSVVAPVIDGGAETSSTRIRALVNSGDVMAAAKLLGRPYWASAGVVRGDGMGRRLGFPTANLDISHEKLLPANGVYASRAGQRRYRPAVSYVGTRPTFDCRRRRRVEVHLLDYRRPVDLVGRRMKVEFVSRLREDRRFRSQEALVEQIGRDCTGARRILAALHE